MAYFEGEIPTMVSGGNNGNGAGFFGNEGLWAVIILAIIFGWGRNGFGNGGNGGTDIGGLVTRSDLCSDLNFNNLESAVRGISNGICDSTFALNNTITNGFANVQSSLCQGFNGVNSAVTNASYQNQIATNNLGYNLQNCCCQLERGIDRLSCENATNTAAIIQSGANNTQKILDYLCNEKIASLQSAAQSQYIINAVAEKILPPARPAYLTCSPFSSSYGFPYAANGYGYYGSNCGCGTTIQ